MDLRGTHFVMGATNQSITKYQSRSPLRISSQGRLSRETC